MFLRHNLIWNATAKGRQMSDDQIQKNQSVDLSAVCALRHFFKHNKPLDFICDV